jgi:hypothetical protein
MIDVASIAPSTRDFLQAIATHKKRLVLVPLVDRVDDAVALAAAGVTAFAVSGPGTAMRALSTAVGAIPILSLAPIADADEALEARGHGADAVVIDAGTDAVGWNSLAKDATSTHMAALAMVVDASSAAVAATTKARGAYVKADSAAAIASLMAKLASMRILAHLPASDETALRALRGVVDAAVVESDLYLSTSFATLREELDP